MTKFQHYTFTVGSLDKDVYTRFKELKEHHSIGSKVAVELCIEAFYFMTHNQDCFTPTGLETIKARLQEVKDRDKGKIKLV